jgi:small-conductance mechanosensitive channel
MDALRQIWLDNNLETFAAALAVMLAVMVALWIARAVLGRVLLGVSRRTSSVIDDIAANAVRSTNLWLLVPVAVHAGASLLELPPKMSSITALAAMVGFVLQAGLWASRVASEWIRSRSRAGPAADGSALMALGLLGFAARVVIWTLVLLVVLDQLGFNITALVAGLGVGGVAIALAVQNVLGDLFASLSIVLDRPFVVGDFIVVGDMMGTVESVGIKTTRVRSLSGEMLVFSNSDLLGSRIRNFQQMRERRVVFSIGVAYETPAEKVRAIPEMLREAVEAQPRTRFDRAHFSAYQDSSLSFEVVYHVLDRDFNLHMDIQQAINLQIFERFAREGIAFAYPTQTLHIATAPEWSEARGTAPATGRAERAGGWRVREPSRG